MKKALFLFILGIVLGGSSSQAQESYWTSGGELIVGFANYDSAGKNISGRPRLSFFFHINAIRNTDFGNNFGIGYGIAARNIGFTKLDEYLHSNEDPSNVPFYEKTKRRSWTLSVPVMIKLGNFKKNRFLFTGAEYSMLFHFKEKRWLNGNKQKRTAWFSDETNRFIPSVFAGFQFSRRYAIKFQYYLDDFLNRDYILRSNSGDIKPYENYNSQLFYVSIQHNFRYKKRAKKSREKREEVPSKDDGAPKAFRLGFH